jgi:DNA topoisomerase VI subunit A
MATEKYRYFNFGDKTLALIDTMNEIIEKYVAQGFVLTIRQLYYQLVARDIIENSQKSYKRVTSIANDARIAGLMDWSAIEDRTRDFVRRQRWGNGAEILEAAASSFHIDMWRRQPRRVFVIIEKEALVGVLTPTCNKYDTPILAARGYPSCTVLRDFAVEDIMPHMDDQDVTILHLGDHDPSGIDMTRDLQERIAMFSRDREHRVELVRLALTMDQIQERSPPPNPAKTTDSRFQQYMEQFGNESWELDALPPEYLVNLVESEIQARIDDGQWEADERKVEDVQERIRKAAESFV